MNIFQIKTKPHGIERFKEFMEENFICIGWPGIGNIDNADKDELRERLKEVYDYDGHKLGNALGQVNTFKNTMNIGDIVLVNEGEYVHLGRVGEYYYEEQFDNDADGMCHRRNVEWEDKIIVSKLSADIQKLISNRNTICRYPNAIDERDLSILLGKDGKIEDENSTKIDELFNEALKILEEELKSNDSERRFKAAIEIIRMKQQLSN